MKPKTEVWLYFVEENVGKKTAQVLCKFCKQRKAKNVSRMKIHLSKCLKAPQTIRDEFSVLLLRQATKGKEASSDVLSPFLPTQSSSPTTDNSISDNVSTRTTTGTATATPSVSKSTSFTSVRSTPFSSSMLSYLDNMKTDEKDKLTSMFAKAIFTSSTPLSIVENENWRAFFSRLRPSFELPGRFVLSTRLLEEEFTKTETQVEAKIATAQHLALQLDGWSNLRNESVINFVITTPQPLFVKSVLTKDASHTSDYLMGLITEVLEKYGPRKFMSLVTDNAKNMRKACTDLEAIYPHITSYGCMAHTLHLLCSDIIKCHSVNRLMTKVKDVIKTVTSSQILSAKFLEIKKELSVNVSLSLPVVTRWGSHVKCLKSILDCKFVLKRLCVSETPTISKRMKPIRDTILLENEDNSFWLQVNDLKVLLEPITTWITTLESDSPKIHLVCQAFKNIEESIADLVHTSVLLAAEEIEQIQTSIKERKSFALKPVHLAADLLNPLSVGSHLTPKENLEAMKFITNASTEMEIPGAQQELGDYMAKTGFFEDSFIWGLLQNVDIIPWWKGYCKDISLSRLAERILTMPSTSAATERSFSTQSTIHTKRRNRLTTERAVKLNYIKHNDKLLSKSLKKKAAEQQNESSIGPMQNTSASNHDVNLLQEQEEAREKRHIETLETDTDTTDTSNPDDFIESSTEGDDDGESWHSNCSNITENGNSNDINVVDSDYNLEHEAPDEVPIPNKTSVSASTPKRPCDVASSRAMKMLRLSKRTIQF